MNRDETGFYDVYGPLVYPWYKTNTFQVIVGLICCALLIFLGFLIYRYWHKKRSITDLEQLILHRALLDKKHDSAVILYDYAIRILKTFFPNIAQKNSLTAQELVILIKTWHDKNLLDGSVDQLVSVVMRTERVRFGKENITWDIVHDDIDYVIAMAKKIQSTSKK